MAIVAVKVTNFTPTDGDYRKGKGWKPFEPSKLYIDQSIKELGLRTGYETDPEKIKILSGIGWEGITTVTNKIGKYNYHFCVQVESIIVGYDGERFYSVSPEAFVRGRKNLNIYEEQAQQIGTQLTPEQQSNLEARL